MSSTENRPEKARSEPRQKLPMVLWVILGLLLAVIAWQQLQINQLITPSQPTESDSEITNEAASGQLQTPQSSEATQAPGINSLPSRGAGPETVSDARRLLEQRAQQVRQLNPEATGQRMFDELKFVTGDDQAALAKLADRLIIEGRARRQLEAQATTGVIDQDQLTSALQQLVDESETYAKELLTPAQFDRYREVRQSWRRGRAHPHANEGE